MKSSGGRNIPEGAVVCRNPQCKHGYHFRRTSCTQQNQHVTPRTPPPDAVTTSSAAFGESIKADKNMNIHSAFKTLHLDATADATAAGETFDPLNFIQPNLDVVSFAPESAPEGEVYNFSDIETLWEISLTEPPDGSTPQQPTVVSTTGTSQWWVSGMLHKNMPPGNLSETWWKNNFDSLLNPIFHSRNIDVGVLKEALEGKTWKVGGLNALYRQVFIRMKTVESVEEETQYVKLLSALWSSDVSVAKGAIFHGELPVYIYRQLVQHADMETLTSFNNKYIRPLEDAESVEDAFFPETPLTRRLGLTLTESFTETLIEEHTTRVKELINDPLTDMNMSQAAKMIPRSKIDELYTSGSLREKKVAINAAGNLDKVHFMLTNIPTHSEGRELSRKERKKVEEDIVKSVLFESPDSLNENSLQHIIQNWGSDPEVNKYLTDFIKKNSRSFSGLKPYQLSDLFGKKTTMRPAEMLRELEKHKRKGEQKPFLKRIADFFN